MIHQPIKIKSRTVSAGKLGDLSVIESSRDLPFPIRRVYYLYGMEEGARRGFHAHKELYQGFAVLHGQCRLLLEGEAGAFDFKLDRADEMVLIPPGYWREMHDLSADTVIMVLASSDYDEGDYIRDYEQFKRWRAAGDRLNRVPYLDLGRYDKLLGKDMEESMARVMKQGRFINGLMVREFEKRFASFCGVGQAVTVGNGLDALTLILQALGLGHGDEVMICAAGFVATALAVNRVGATPVFVDCEPGGNLDPADLERAFSPSVKAVIPTHLYGRPAAWEVIEDFAAPRGLYLIEDACQAHGASYRGRRCGSLGRAAAFSFYPTKNLGALGDGGAVLTDDSALADQVRLLANYGSPQRGEHILRGWNSRFDEIQAAALLVKLSHLEDWNQSRRRLVSVYRETLPDLADHLLLPPIEPENQPCWHVYAVRVKNGLRGELASYLARRGVETNIHYPTAIHRQKCYESSSGRACPEAEAWAGETLSLPLDALHKPEELHYVSRIIHEFYEGHP